MQSKGGKSLAIFGDRRAKKIMTLFVIVTIVSVIFGLLVGFWIS